jgi:tetratricopeptide (TPR) repeat protein
MKWPLALVLAAATAHAQPAPDDPVAQAKQLYADGKRFYDIGDYTHAIESWKHAYLLSNAPMLLFNVAQAYRLSGDCGNALTMYANYERADPALPNRDDLEQAKARCNREPTKTNPPEPAPPSTVAPATTPPPPTKTVVDDGGGFRIAGIAIGGGGVALALTSLYFAHRASTEADYVSQHTGVWTPTDRAHEDSGKTAQSVAIGTAIAAPLALAAGAYLYYRGSHRSHIEVAIGRSHTEVTWSVSF